MLYRTNRFSSCQESRSCSKKIVKTHGHSGICTSKHQRQPAIKTELDETMLLDQQSSLLNEYMFGCQRGTVKNTRQTIIKERELAEPQVQMENRRLRQINHSLNKRFRQFLHEYGFQKQEIARLRSENEKLHRKINAKKFKSCRQNTLENYLPTDLIIEQEEQSERPRKFARTKSEVQTRCNQGRGFACYADTRF